MKYVPLILIAALALSACKTSLEVTKVSSQVPFTLKDAAVVESMSHSYWIATDSASTVFISFTQEDLNKLCRTASPSGGTQ